MRRGFKTEAETIAEDIRKELELKPTDPLDPFALAQHLEIPTMKLSELSSISDTPEIIGRLMVDEGAETFSGITIFLENFRLIVYNDSHHPNRQVNDITHEIAHCLLEHVPNPVLSHTGTRYWNGDMEEEANWLAGALLIPRSGALSLYKAKPDIGQLARHFGVSVQLCKQRINQTGIVAQVNRTHMLYARSA